MIIINNNNNSINNKENNSSITNNKFTQYNTIKFNKKTEKENKIKMYIRYKTNYQLPLILRWINFLKNMALTILSFNSMPSISFIYQYD